MPTQETVAATGVPAFSPGRDCRIYERHACRVETSCHPPTVWGGQDTHWQAHVRDVSQGGLALVLRRRFEKGTGLAVELPGAADEEPSTVLVRVVRVSAQPDGFWLLGCAFISALSEDEVQALVGTQAIPGEQQQADGAEEAPTGSSIAAAVPSEANRIQVGRVLLEGVLATGEVVHRWLDRLYLREAWPVTAGRRFVLRTNRRPAGRVGVRLQVESCTRRGPHWVLRCRLSPADPAHVASVLALSVLHPYRTS
ncbi:MAG TPA: PilZ domain-containing protein [Gemmataceae bacterium]|nr:PilZ domain-containing protein [Gemmataceae bacterium]